MLERNFHVQFVSYLMRLLTKIIRSLHKLQLQSKIIQTILNFLTFHRCTSHCSTFQYQLHFKVNFLVSAHLYILQLFALSFLLFIAFAFLYLMLVSHFIHFSDSVLLPLYLVFEFIKRQNWLFYAAKLADAKEGYLIQDAQLLLNFMLKVLLFQFDCYLITTVSRVYPIQIHVGKVLDFFQTLLFFIFIGIIQLKYKMLLALML